jgi:hypothetical protein
MIARLQLQLPRFDFLLLSKGVRLEHTLHDLIEGAGVRQIMQITFETVYLRSRVISLRIGLGLDLQLFHLLRRFMIVA